MPILSLGELASTATTFAGGRLDWTLSEASRYVNFAYFEVSQKAGHVPKEAIAISSTTTGENRIAFPSDFDYPMALTLFVGSTSTATTSNATRVVPLAQKDARWFDSQDLASGEPEAYVFYGTSIELYPSPNSAWSLQLRYMSKNPTLVASTDTPVLDERWHPAILYKTVELLEASRNNVEGEAIARNRYLGYMASVPTDLQLKQRDRASMVMRFARSERDLV